MPYVNLNGQLVEVTQEQFDIYTIGQNVNASTATIQTSVPNIAAGGTVTQSFTGTAEVLTPNTTNTSPGQTLQEIPVTATQSPSSVDVNNTLSPGETIVSASALDTSPASTNFGTSVQTFDDGTTLQKFDAGSVLATATDGSVTATEATPVDPANDWQAEVARTQANATTTYNADGTVASVNDGARTSADNLNASANIQGLIKNAQQQNVIAAQRKQINNGDWRVRLRLAPQAQYLYRAKEPGILQPLKITDGVIFPYTPAITTAYRANYSNYDLTHSNYRGYFYQNSYVDAINVTAVFTAQDTNDANYLLAVIHFFRSVTKMFYGKDQLRGSPPPVVYLTGLGEYQFNEHPCLVQQFSYNLPADVDYIRAGSPNNAGLDFNNIRDRQSVATNSIFNSINRLAAAFLTKGAIGQGTNASAPPTLGLNRPTYVPTKMEIQLTLLPIQSRQQVSQQFSLEGFASGSLLKGGFW